MQLLPGLNRDLRGIGGALGGGTAGGTADKRSGEREDTMRIGETSTTPTRH